MAEVASIKFLKWSSLYEHERPFQIFMELRPESEDRRNTNISWDEKTVTVEDFRGRAKEFQLDSHGFSSCHLPGFTELADKDTIEQQYLPAVEDILRTHLEDFGTVFIFDWRIRNSRSDTVTDMINFSDKTTPLLPSNYAHIDTGPISVIQRIQKSFPKDAKRILQQRVRAVNVWKPLSHPVEEYPLAVCDGTSVKPEDLVETDSVRQGNVSTNYYVKYHASQRWYFLNHQSPDEALIFKHFDTKPGVKAPYALHSSIKLQKTSEVARPRKSIEVRALVFSGIF
ncbi:hypothetical protein DL766_009345 [Monosporascus sp. MC13-8B]|uniref:Methyltransferase CmcJ n=1 Tax=Monosporascus cannonballus TaxID=155416 RepID=A0ABY0GXP1_9PEZI|nr:hypothetical protein DL762_008148 [Monosporascus cannonballus]RYO87583.1 hypothetical protein DL763_006284 [Monosporascus cannonballus]RYP15652.1 hypothetical protein DL766_009345 [Monosporascus sp. MC13-8B]